MRLRPLRAAPHAGTVTGLGLIVATTATALGLLVAGPFGSPAGAAGGPGTVDVEASHPAGGTAIHFIVRVTGRDDGEPATDATVTATAVGADGQKVDPVDLEPADSDGRYAGVIDFPQAGTWTVEFTSTNPDGSADVTKDVTAPASGDDSGSATGSDRAVGDAATGGFAPADDGTGSSNQATGNNDDSGMPTWLVAVALAVIIGGAYTSIRAVRRYRAVAADEAGQFDAIATPRTDGQEASSGADAGPGTTAGT